MVDANIATIKSVTFHPVLDGNQPIEIPVSIDLSFVNGPTLTYDHSPESKTYNVDPFPLNINHGGAISGKLYALDRQRNSGYYFTLYPMMMPKDLSSDLDIFVSVMGPAISWILSVSSVTEFVEEIKEPNCN
jgi:hypothetical protein